MTLDLSGLIPSFCKVMKAAVLQSHLFVSSHEGIHLKPEMNVRDEQMLIVLISFDNEAGYLR